MGVAGLDPLSSPSSLRKWLMLSAKCSGMTPNWFWRAAAWITPGPGVVDGVGGCPVLAPLTTPSSWSLLMPSATWSGVKPANCAGEGEKGVGAGVPGKLVPSM